MSYYLESTPRTDGYRMPGEFETHAGCWVLFPERPDTWRDGAIPAQRVFVDVAKAIAQFEPVTVCANTSVYEIARAMLPRHIRVIELSYNDSWMRDNGPSFVVNSENQVRGVDWNFNAWGGLDGGLYFPWDKDNLVASKVLGIVGAGAYKSPLTNEGGAIHVDGDGTLITTKSVLTNPNRNPDLSIGKIEQILSDYLAVDKVIWLELEGDDETDGHIDGVCCFVRPSVVLLSWTDNQDSNIYEECHEAYDQLMLQKDAKGRSFEIIKLPYADLQPMTKAESDGVHQVDMTLPRLEGMPVFGGYINFYIANGGIVVPNFGVETDNEAMQVLQEAFPNRKIVGVSGGREISLGGGNIHCITQQQPVGIPML